MAKVKVQISIDNGILNELDDYCEKNYLNRSIAITQAVNTMIVQQKMIDAISNVSVALKKAAETGTLNDETKKEMESFEALSKLFIK